MIISLSDGAITVKEQDDFGSFKVQVDRSFTAQAADDLLRSSAAGYLESDFHAWIRTDWLSEKGNTTPDWNERLTGMFDYAKFKGWATGNLIRAHVEAP